MRWNLSSNNLLAGLLAVASAACGVEESPIPQPPPQSREISGHTITSYRYAFDLSSARLTTTLSLNVAPTGGNCVRLPSLLPVLSGQWNGATATTSHDGSLLQLCGPSVGGGLLSLGATTQLVEGTESEMGVGFTRRSDARGNTFTYLQNWLERCHRYGPCDNSVGRQSSFDIEVSHDPQSVVLCPGKRESSGGKTRCTILDREAPTYSAVSVLANPAWRPTTLISRSDALVTLYETPDGPVASALDVASLDEFLEWTYDLLGPLPYGSELRLATGPFQWLGYEHPANILLNESLPELPTPYANPTAHTVMHEIIHQWAGNRTTMADARDLVWKEAIAEYLTYVFEDEHRPAGEAEASRRYWKQSGRFASLWPSPLDEVRPPLSAMIGNAYGAGTMALFVQLEPFIGRTAILRGIQRFLSRPGLASVTDLQRALEAESGANLARYFEVWVRGAGEALRPKMEVSRDGSTYIVRQVQEGPVMPCVVEVELQGAAKSVRFEARFGLSSEAREVRVPVNADGAVNRIVVDPDARVMEWSLPSRPAASGEMIWHL